MMKLRVASKADKKLLRWLFRTALAGLLTIGLTLAIRVATKPPPPPKRDYVAEYNALLDKLGTYDPDVWSQVAAEVQTYELICEEAGREVAAQIGREYMPVDQADVLELIAPPDEQDPDRLRAAQLAYDKLVAADIGAALDLPFRSRRVVAPLTPAKAQKNDVATLIPLCFVAIVQSERAVRDGNREAATTHFLRQLNATVRATHGSIGKDTFSAMRLVSLSWSHLSTMADHNSIDAHSLLTALPASLPIDDILLRNIEADRLIMLDSYDRLFNGDPTGTLARYNMPVRLWMSHREHYDSINEQFDAAEAWAKLSRSARRSSNIPSPSKTLSSTVNCQQLIDVNKSFANSLDSIDVTFQGIRLMLALEIHRDRNGDFPDALEDIAPEILPALPIDPFARDGRFRYARTETGYRLWSVGYDSIADNGKQSTGQHAMHPDATGGDFLIFPR